MATESVNERCENCEFVDRGMDEYCHEVYWTSNRCPINKILTAYRKINRRNCPIELMTGYTGCTKFKEDTEYKRKNEEMDIFLKELHAKRGYCKMPKLTSEITESDVLDHVCKQGKYINGEYMVSWNGKAYAANDTRTLVANICKVEGIEGAKP